MQQQHNRNEGDARRIAGTSWNNQWSTIASIASLSFEITNGFTGLPLNGSGKLSDP